PIFSTLIKRGLVVVVNTTQISTSAENLPTFLVKRIEGIGGEEIKFESSTITSYVKFYDDLSMQADGYYYYFVPLNHLIVLSDAVGIDSKHFGPVPINSLDGIVIFK
ncbi:MAG: hypothetical protein WBC91_19220, partial [Phototrophicaceae bacterium]